MRDSRRRLGSRVRETRIARSARDRDRARLVLELASRRRRALREEYLELQRERAECEARAAERVHAIVAEAVDTEARIRRWIEEEARRLETRVAEERDRCALAREAEMADLARRKEELDRKIDR